MARIRSIKPEFCSSADTGALSRDARLFFLQLLTEADDEGRLLWIPRRLCGVLYPFDVDVGDADLERWAQECAARGMLTIYRNGTWLLVQITNWSKHQRINRSTASKFPPPSDESSVIAHGALSESSVSPPGVLSEDVHRERNREGEQGTGKGNREREQGKPPASSSPQAPRTADPKTVDLEKHREERKRARLSQITEEAIAAYNAILGKPKGLLPAVNAKVGKERRRKEVARCLKVASDICQDQYGDKHVTPQFWQDYFAEVDRDPFRSGRQASSGEHANWKPDFEYLTREATMLKVFEKSEAAA